MRRVLREVFNVGNSVRFNALKANSTSPTLPVSCKSHGHCHQPGHNPHTGVEGLDSLVGNAVEAMKTGGQHIYDAFYTTKGINGSACGSPAATSTNTPQRGESGPATPPAAAEPSSPSSSPPEPASDLHDSPLV